MEDFFKKFVSKKARNRYNPISSKKSFSNKMKNQSELGKRGYSTSLSKDERIRIIKLTFEEVELLHIVNILVMNSARAKTKLNPPIQAIIVWESDLKWIKEELWQGEFIWPKTYRLSS